MFKGSTYYLFIPISQVITSQCLYQIVKLVFLKVMYDLLFLFTKYCPDDDIVANSCLLVLVPFCKLMRMKELTLSCDTKWEEKARQEITRGNDSISCDSHGVTYNLQVLCFPQSKQ